MIILSKFKLAQLFDYRKIWAPSLSSPLNLSGCWDITKGNLTKDYINWGDIYSIEFDIVVTKLNDDWMNVFHFTGTNKNYGDHGDRVPALFINKAGYFHFVTSLNDNANYDKSFHSELGRTYHVTIQQSKEGNKYWYEIVLDSGSILREQNMNPQTYSTVKLYTSDPWHDPFSSDFGNVCNVKIQQGGKF